MDVSDWPMDQETWKEEYFKYQNEYMSILNEKYNKHVIMSNFMKNNIVLNNLLLNLKNKSTPEKLQRLQNRVDEFNTKLNEIQTEIENTEDNEEKEKLEVKKETLVNPALLEACEDYLKAFKTFNKYEFGSRMRESLWRPPTGKDDGGYDDDSGGPMYKKYMSHFDTLKQSGQGKTKKKKTKKRGGKQVKRSSKKKRGSKKKRKTKSKTRK